MTENKEGDSRPGSRTIDHIPAGFIRQTPYDKLKVELLPKRKTGPMFGMQQPSINGSHLAAGYKTYLSKLNTPVNVNPSEQPSTRDDSRRTMLLRQRSNAPYSDLSQQEKGRKSALARQNPQV